MHSYAARTIHSCESHLHFAGARGRRMSAKKLSGFPQRRAALWNQVRRELPSMRNHLPDFQFNGHSRGASAFGETRRIIPQDFVLAHMNEQRRKPSEIRIQRGSERIARIRVAK